MPGAPDPSTLTPMMQQYYQLKAEAEEAILFFRMGDFFEVFGDDALAVAPLLNLTLTSRERGDQQRIPFCGVPHHSAAGYWNRLLRLRFKVAVADQVEDPASAKGLVKRALTRFLTPGCVQELDGLEPGEPNYLAAADQLPGDSEWSYGCCDVSTGEFRVGRLPDLDAVIRKVTEMRPRELLLRAFRRDLFEHRLSRLTHPPVISTLPEGSLRDGEARRERLRMVFGDTDRDEPLAAAILEHLERLLIGTAAFRRLDPLEPPQTAELGVQAIRDLELLETLRGRQGEGSLFHTVNRCASPMGARLLRWRLTHPFRDGAAITGEHERIARLLAGDGVRPLADALRGLPDLERLTARLLSGNIRVPELARLRAATQQLERVAGLLCGPWALLAWPEESVAVSREVGEQLTTALAAEPAALGSGSGVFRDGFDAELDRVAALATRGQEAIAAYQARLREETGIASLKIKPHKSFGLLIDVTRANLSLVPGSFIRKQTMVGGERYVTPELSELEDTLSSAHDEAVAREAALFEQLVAELAPHGPGLQRMSAEVAALDVALGFALLASEEGYCRPRLTPDRLRLKGARHPMVECSLGADHYTPNDLSLSRERMAVITGPNMAGKSTVMRQTALCAVLSQAGGFVPAQEADLPVFTGFYTRVGASDDLAQGLSTFMVEMTEAAHILRHADRNSLVIVDEIGRGTSTTDGRAIAQAVMADLARRGSWVLFATHFHELGELAQGDAQIRALQTEVIAGGELRFTHRLTEGVCSDSYGLEVARLAGLPSEVVAEARHHLRDLAPAARRPPVLKRPPTAASPAPLFD